MIPRLAITGVRRRFGGHLALDGVSLALAPGEILAVLGDSGCGKSTLLRVVAGLEEADEGDIRLDGCSLLGVAPERRGVGLMFQDYALFPHLTILDNVRFGRDGEGRPLSREAGLTRLREVGLAQRAGDYPPTLSGGEAQRVALARALAPAPRVLLLDEPFSNLDRRTRERVRGDTLTLLRTAAITTILVTHDPAEALDLADRIALMRAGRIVQAGTAEELYRSPASPFVAATFGEIVVLDGHAEGRMVDTPLGPLSLPGDAPAGRVRVGLRPEAFRLLPAGEGIAAEVRGRRFLGPVAALTLAVAGLPEPLRLRVSPEDATTPGERVGLTVDAAGLVVFPPAATTDDAQGSQAA